MTDRERLDRERKWVTTRFHCDRDGMFDELATVISFDVRAFNKLAGEGRRATVRNLDDGTVAVSRGHRAASISKKGDAIRVIVLHGGSTTEDFEILPVWNEDAVRCDLIIDGKAVSTHCASQKAIGAVLFP